MNVKTILITVSGPDRPGMVSALAEAVAQYDGNWLDSRMANLGGQFAGILRVEVDSARQQDLQAALQALHSETLHVTLQPVEESHVSPSGRELELELLGQDHPGIVRDISQALSQIGVSVQSFDSWLEEASMAGGVLFHAHAHLRVPDSLTTDALHEQLHALSDSLMVDINLEELD